jgi:hypothetical protein
MSVEGPPRVMDQYFEEMGNGDVASILGEDGVFR